MKKFAAAAVIPLCAGFLWAQEPGTTTTTTTTKTTYNGTLVDAGCYTTQTEHKETTADREQGATTTTTTRTEETKCPVTTTTTTFGLVTPEGKYVRFDEPSNTRIVEVVKGNKKWRKYMTERQPLKVHVVGTPNGDMVVMETIK